jgi:hypothetical protein
MDVALDVRVVEGEIKVADIVVRLTLDEARWITLEHSGPHTPIRIIRGPTDDLVDGLRTAIERYEREQRFEQH